MPKANFRHAHRKLVPHSKACPEHALFGQIPSKGVLSHGESFQIKINNNWLRNGEKRFQGYPHALRRLGTQLFYHEVRYFYLVNVLFMSRTTGQKKKVGVTV